MTIEARFRIDRGAFVLDAHLDIPGRGITALFGPSGSGKSTILHCLAGLERAPDGYLCVDGIVWQDQRTFLPAHRRPIGYVFQQAGLFPHLDVHRNLEYGLRRLAPDARRVKFDDVADLLGLTSLLRRMPHELSGGQRQRVAVGRALLASPGLLLMDEPLASLDLQSKAEIMPFLERLHVELATPVVYVSHAPDEVVRLADHMIVLDDGRVRATGSVAEVFARTDLPLARRDEASVVLEARVSGFDERYGITQLDFAGGTLRVPRDRLAIDTNVRVRVFARDVSLSLDRAHDSTISNIVPVQIIRIISDPNDAQVLVQLESGGATLLASITRESLDRLALRTGRAVFAQIKAVALT